MDSAIYKAMGDFISLLFPGIEIVPGQVNFVAMPKNPCVVMTIISNRRLATNLHRYNDTGDITTSTEAITRKAAVTVQLDFFGEGSASRSHDFCAAFYDDYAFTRMQGVKPLSVTDPKKLPFIDDHRNWYARWMCEADVQVNRETVLQQQFFDKPNFQHVDGAEGISPVDIFHEV